MSEFCIPLYRLLFGATRKLNLLFLLGTFASIMLKKTWPSGIPESQAHFAFLKSSREPWRWKGFELW